MARKAWKDRKPQEKKWFLIRVIGGALFLVGGAVFAIVSLYMNGWDFVQFVKNPTVALVALVVIALGITLISFAEVK